MFWRDKAMEELCRQRMHVKSHRWMDPYSDGDIFLPFARALSLSLSLAAPSAPFTTSLKAFVQVQRKFTKKAMNECYSKQLEHTYTHTHTQRKK